MGFGEPDRHDRRVSELCIEIGRELGMSPADQLILSGAGLMHDIGKLGIPRAILHKQGPLTEAEWRVMKTHPQIGITILGGRSRMTREMLGILYHHERMDGSGYPHGLISSEIPIEARIVAVADTYDVLTSDRPYRSAFTHFAALRTVLLDAGPLLDPEVVAALQRVLSVRREGIVA